MTANEILSLDVNTSTIRAPSLGDTYIAPRAVKVTGVANQNLPYYGSTYDYLNVYIAAGGSLVLSSLSFDEAYAFCLGLNVKKTNSSGGYYYGNYIDVTYAVTSPTQGYGSATGGYFSAAVIGADHKSTDSEGGLFGVVGFATFAPTTPNTSIQTVIGSAVGAYNEAKCTQVIGGSFVTRCYSNSVTTDAYGLRIICGTIGSNVNITNRYGIYQIGASFKNVFEGAVECDNYLAGNELSADPIDPPDGQWRLWQSDGTGAGDDGDIMMKITAGGVTKTVTLIDFSSIL